MIITRRATSAKTSIVPLHRLRVMDDFYDGSELRTHFDAIFSNPYGGAQFNQNYWYVPDLYTYVRVDARQFPGIEGLTQKIAEICAPELGSCIVTAPLLSFYVNGCFQAIHNDSMNGFYGYVFSLTDWTNRSFMGGETLVGKPQWDLEPRRTGTKHAFFDVIEPKLNRLVLFDDRLPHGVEHVQGTMDPRRGRIVIHGHVQLAN